MDRSGKTILVIGATGQQGGVTARHLLADGWRVRALVRHPDSPASQALAAAGAEIVPGDLLDRTSLDRAVDGAYGVFSVQNTWTAGPEGEVVQGRNIADAAAGAGVRHFVYSSAESGDPKARQPYMISKEKVEEHIRELGLPATIWRPVTFMENFLRQRDWILGGRLAWPLWPESMTYLIALDDIGRFVALAFGDPERFLGTSMAIAGDAMPMTAVADTFARALGTKVDFQQVDEMAGIPSPPRPAAGEVQHVRADVEACRKLLPGLRTLRDWIEETDWGLAGMPPSRRGEGSPGTVKGNQCPSGECLSGWSGQRSAQPTEGSAFSAESRWLTAESVRPDSPFPDGHELGQPTPLLNRIPRSR